MITYKALLEKLQKLTEDQLSKNAIIYDEVNEELMAVDDIDFAVGSSGPFADSDPMLLIDNGYEWLPEYNESEDIDSADDDDDYEADLDDGDSSKDDE